MYVILYEEIVDMKRGIKYFELLKEIVCADFKTQHDCDRKINHLLCKILHTMSM